MKIHLLTLAMATAIAFPSTINGSTVHELRGEKFDVDTLRHYKNGPGMTFTALRYQSQTRSAKHFTAYVVTTDLANSPNVDFRMHLGKDSVHTAERVTDVIKRKSDAGNQYIAAINGDFFITWSSTPGMLGYPNMTACSDGQMALSDNVDHDNHVDAWIMDRNRGMWCDQTVLDNTLTWPDGSTTTLYGVNFARRDDARRDSESDENDVVFYNSHRGGYTGSAKGWTEVTVRLADGEQWRINSPVRLEVTADPRTGGHTAIPANGGVIAAATKAAGKVASLKPGDIVTLNIGLSLPTFDGLRPDVKEVVGGDVTLLRNGEAVMTANRFINSRDGEYPRTMVGYDQNRTKMVWCAVDGKTAANTGCTYPQGAEMMRYYGCVDAINFDGGGSTMMWLQQPGIVNSPSDGNERAVGNGLYAVMTTPVDNEIAEIRFMDWSKHLPQYGQYSPVIYGYNQYGQLIDTDVKGFTLSAPAELGRIEGSTLLADGSGCHPLKAALGTLEASIAVNVTAGGDISFGLDKMLIDNIHDWKIETFATVNGDKMPLAPQALAWNSDKPEVVSVNADGHLKGAADGVATVSGAVGDFNGTVEVTVECPRDHYMNLPADLSQWTVKSTSATARLSTLGTDGLAIDYTITGSRNPTVTLTPVGGSRLWSIPDGLQIEVKATGAEISKENVTIKPNGGRNTAHGLTGITLGETHSQSIPMTDFIDPTDQRVWPVTLVSISFSLKGNGSGRIELPRIATIYEGYSGVAEPTIPGGDGFDPYAPVEYYNLQGMRITTPSPGQIVIRRQGSRVEKIII